jgi:hypothetical protein
MTYQPTTDPNVPPAPYYPVPPGCELTLPVGAVQGFNQPNDVLTVQHLLNGVPPKDGGPDQPLTEDGVCGPRTIQAIAKFSRAHSWPTDTIYPNSALHNMLCFYSNNAGLMPNPYTP